MIRLLVLLVRLKVMAARAPQRPANETGVLAAIAAAGSTILVLIPEHLSKENHEGSAPVLGMGCEVAFLRRIHVLAVPVILNNRDLRGQDFGPNRRFQF
jgi:hypothetical protein